MKKVAIGGGQGFWGDSPDAAIHMIRNADIQYMGCDYLAELTLSIMAKQQLKDPTKGFAPDFTTRILKEAGKEAWDKHIKICTNAGGMNINGCVDGIRQWAEGNSMSGYKIGYVTGDNIKDKIPQLLKDGWTFPNFDYDGNFNDILDKIYNCNVYIGHEGIEGCLAEGADVVITGRAADSALFLAPLKYEFGWAADDWDNLARGIMAGHLLECGGQGAGGNYMYDWRNVPRMDERSQTQNKARAMAVLASRLHAAQVAEQQAKEASERKSLIGSGDRSERIRTYNYPQGRVTDHRINLTLYRLEAIMNGDLEEIITALTTQHQAEQLAALA